MRDGTYWAYQETEVAGAELFRQAMGSVKKIPYREDSRRRQHADASAELYRDLGNRHGQANALTGVVRQLTGGIRTPPGP